MKKLLIFIAVNLVKVVIEKVTELIHEKFGKKHLPVLYKEEVKQLTTESKQDPVTGNSEEKEINLESKIKEWGIQHFRYHELVTLHNKAWDGDLYIEPDVAILDNIKDTILVADRIRVAYGSSVRITSGWRPIPYNRLVGSTDTSEHVQFRALDLVAGDGDYARFTKVVLDVVTQCRKEGMNVGVGQYPNSKFIHIDTNAVGKARNRSWVTN